MKIPLIFLDNKKRNLILWITDMTLAIASYFYVTNPVYIQKVIAGIDFATLRPDLEPEALQSAEFFELIYKMTNMVAILTIAIIALLHTVVFYRCYLRKTAAIAYVKIYSILAALSLLMWFVYNIHVKSFLILIPTVIYVLIFLAEKQTPKASAKLTP